MASEIRVPTLGESVTEATIAQWYKKPGDAVAMDEPLCELETDKVTIEVPAQSAGVLEEVVVNEGETVEVGALLGSIGEGAGTVHRLHLKPSPRQPKRHRLKQPQKPKSRKSRPVSGSADTNGRAGCIKRHIGRYQRFITGRTPCG